MLADCSHPPIQLVSGVGATALETKLEARVSTIGGILDTLETFIFMFSRFGCAQPYDDRESTVDLLHGVIDEIRDSMHRAIRTSGGALRFVGPKAPDPDKFLRHSDGRAPRARSAGSQNESSKELSGLVDTS